MSLDDLFSERDHQNNQHVYGAVVAIVTNNKDPEGMGRVKVKFPWRGENDESYWARLSSPMAGNDRGMVFYPEVHDEVLVLFEQGNINFPYVIGSLWNGKDKPPETNEDGKNNIRKIRSRSGHEIIFNDDANSKQENLEIKTNSGHKIVLNDSNGQEKIEIVDKTGSNKITIDSVQNSINMECATKISLNANIIEIEGTSSLTLKSDGVLTIQGLPVNIN